MRAEDRRPDEAVRAGKPAAVLFDIDETLVHTGGAGARSWAYAFDKLYGVEADIGKHTSAGETDPEVGTETFEAVLGRKPAPSEMVAIYAQYLLHLAEDIWQSKEYRVFDGVEDTLSKLSGAGVILGVVSGAMEGAARTKMMPGNLNRFFIFGAYGSDSPDRAELTRMAIAKAARLHGRDLAKNEVMVVGDTPRDMEATNQAGATSVGVATGHYSAAQLAAAGGVCVLASLAEPFPGT
ncbi:MAG TPA: HAD family hydrolase [Candidatus Nanopelagicaceae bacterium]|nr:HAD family hydrolase [Candidatus Nanopelagicaceae bacterium]